VNELVGILALLALAFVGLYLLSAPD
jgi:hypothetical protein